MIVRSPRPRPSARARSRPHLLWLLVPFVLYLGALPLVNRVRPVVFGVPFLFLWLLAATVLTPVCVWLAHRGDRRIEERETRKDAEDAGDGGRA
ncbi:DUF3311 domain-containing protein [Streptomyces sp. DSM 118878]